MPNQDLSRVSDRLEAMNAKNDELREKLAAREAKKVELAGEQNRLQQVLAAKIADLQSQLSALRNSHAIDATAFDAETTAIKRRRDELKADYGVLKPVLDALLVPENTTPEDAPE